MRKNQMSIIMLMIMLALLATMSLGCGVGRGKIAVIPLTGSITAGSGSFLWGAVISPEQVRGHLERARADGAVRAIVLRVQSPGGSVAACQEIVREIEATEKPIVVSMGDMAASGGYFISAKADRIVASPGTLTGSIGVISQMPNLAGLYEKLGIEMNIFKAGKYKDMFAGLRELTPEEQQIMQEITDQCYDQFVQEVVEGRGLTEDEVRELATGQLYTGVQAKELGLVDELGGLQTAIDLAADLAGVEKPRVETYGEPSLLKQLTGLSLNEWRGLIKLRLLGPENTIILDALTRSYFQPMYLCQ